MSCEGIMEVIVKERIGAYGVIIQNGKIALVRKANGGYKGKLDLPGGGIEHTESSIDTLKREIKEEINGTVVSQKLIDVVATNIVWQMDTELMEDLHHIGVIYEVNIAEADLKSDADGLDSLGASWGDLTTLNIEELSPFAKFAVNKYR